MAMLRTLARILAVSAFAVVAALPMTASAAGGGGGTDNGMTITFGSTANSEIGVKS